MSVPSTKEAALRVAALMMACGQPGDDTKQVVSDMREVLAPILDDPRQMEWTVMYLAMVLTRTIRKVAPYVQAPPEVGGDFVHQVVVQIMEQSGQW